MTMHFSDSYIRYKSYFKQKKEGVYERFDTVYFWVELSYENSKMAPLEPTEKLETAPKAAAPKPSNSMAPLKPAEILDATINIGVGKANSSVSKLIMLGILAGAFIAFAAAGSNMAAFNALGDAGTFGYGRWIAGMVFATGLMLVVCCGAELFTGNTLMVCSVLEKKINVSGMLRNWVIVYIANLVGSIFIAYLVVNSGLLASGDGALGATTVSIAAGKCNLEFLPAFYRGILCNWLVCLAVWMAFGADTMVGKFLSCFFPISLFVTSGYEHSVANMYYIPAGLFAKGEFGASLDPAVIENLTWGGFFIDNLIPVTLGNIVGGMILVGMVYWFSYKKA